jgi:hypothetical protein
MKVTAQGLLTAIPNVIVCILASWLFGLMLFVASLMIINPTPALTVEQAMGLELMGKYVGAAMGLCVSAFLIASFALLALSASFIAFEGIKWLALRTKEGRR